jgi:hypothetical protein
VLLIEQTYTVELGLRIFAGYYLDIHRFLEAVCSVPDSGMTEIAGIGVRVPFRRRGVCGRRARRVDNPVSA